MDESLDSFESAKLTVPEAWTLAHGMSGRSPDTQRYLRDELRNLAKHVNEEKQQETSQPRVDKLLLTVFWLTCAIEAWASWNQGKT